MAGDIGSRDMAVANVMVNIARGCIGAPFRLHGRDIWTGLDCVGLVLTALRGAGCRRAERAVPVGYAMRGGHQAEHEAALRAAGLQPVKDIQAGDIILAEAGPAQHHLMVATGSGFIHAHAGLRRVVEMPGECPWPVLGRWRWAGSR